MSDGLIDKQTAAAFIKQLREEGEGTAANVATINIVWSFYSNDIDLPDVTEEEAEKILSDLPTSYERERE